MKRPLWRQIIPNHLTLKNGRLENSFFNKLEKGKFKGQWESPEIMVNVNRGDLGSLLLNDQEVTAIEALMKTLTDGYDIKPIRGH